MLDDKITEVIFVGLPGPTHHYGGLSQDNVASSTNRGSSSNPRQAALQVVELTRLLGRLGMRAAILPPLLRPHLPLLRQHFPGTDEAVILQAASSSPALLEKASSASAMWTANAATVTPAIDAGDHQLHITTANLFTHLHRRIEAEDTHRVLSAIFAGVPDCIVHPPLSAAAGRYDEGAANHMRLSPTHSSPGLHVFAYGARDGRQTLSASEAVAAQHRITADRALFLPQNPEAIRQGVFHNDVIAVSNEGVLLAHEQAYRGGRDDIVQIAQAYWALHPGRELTTILIREEDLSIEEAVQTYFFNSQIVTRPDGNMTVIAPMEAEILHEGKAARLLERIRADGGNPIDDIHYIDLRQSMRNGGGPACLRLRVPVTGVQLEALESHAQVMASDALLAAVEGLIGEHYPETLLPQDLGNPKLYQRSQALLAALSKVMQLPLLA